MNLKSIQIGKAYSSDNCNVLESFYIPALEASVDYRRLAGFFSSASLAVAARGIAGLIRNGGNMKIVVAPRLSDADVEAIVKASEDPDGCIARRMIAELDDLEDEFVRNHVLALGWMIANGKLAVKAALVHDPEGCPLPQVRIEQTGLFHQKVGILKDSQGNSLSFSGSINETAAGWLDNIEQFKVFRSWEPTESDWVEIDSRSFDRFWNNESPTVTVVDIPRAVKQKLIEIAPPNIDHLNLVDRSRPLRRSRVQLYEHQRTAVARWVANGMRGIFEMATGTGKTFAALGCLEEAWHRDVGLAVIACPYHHLVEQWQGDAQEFGSTYDQVVVADGTARGWRDILTSALMDLRLRHVRKVLVFTTHDTASSSSFIGIIGSNPIPTRRLFIADEVHGMGSAERRKGFLEQYDARLGLSATPARWFDLTGTQVIESYFGQAVYAFSLHQAITTVNPARNETYLAPFRYLPRFVSLTDDELAEYVDLTRAIVRQHSGSITDERRAELFERLLFKRANLIKGATQKLPALESLLDELGTDVQWALIYCDPQLIDEVARIVGRRGIAAHKFTMREGTSPEKKYGNKSQREYLLKRFAQGQFQILIAMKCLDEGVDVPPARTAVLMSSSKNPREYIQRIGRVIRRYPGKRQATIYDMIVAPPIEEMPSDLRAVELRIFESEMRRCDEVATEALNSAEALGAIYDVKNRLLGVRK
jgi:superfamily II DNA or RNA helicase